MPIQLFFTSILNHLFAAPVDTLLGLVHVTPQYAQAPITNTFAMELLLFRHGWCRRRPMLPCRWVSRW